MGLNNITKVSNLNIGTNLHTKKAENETSFGEYLKEALGNVNKLQVEADEFKKLLATGQIDNIHQVTIATEKADIALQMTMAVRNKILDAYKEIMRMQI